MTVIGKALDWLVSLVADKIVAGIWLRFTRRARDEGRARELGDERVTRLRNALEMLSDGLALNLNDEESRAKISKAANELQIEGPENIDEDLDRVVLAAEKQLAHGNLMSQQAIHDLMKPIRAKVGPMLGKRG